MNEIKVNTPGIKAQIYPFEASPESIKLYDKIAAQMYVLLSKLAQELNLNVSNFRAFFDGLYHGKEKRSTDFTIQIKDPSDTWKEPWIGNPLIAQTVSDEAVILWTYNNVVYDDFIESPTLSQLIPIIEEKNLIGAVSQFAAKIQGNLTDEEKELIAPNTPILVTGKDLKEIKINRPVNKLFKFVVTKKFDIHDWEGRLYFRNELIDKSARLVEDSSKRRIIAYIDPDQTELQKDLEPHISRFDNGKFFMYAMEGGDAKKAFHIEGDQLENRVDIVDEIDEIRISKPENKLFKFVVTEKRYNSNVRGDVDNWIGKLYFRDKLIDENAFLLNKKNLIANVGSKQTELQKTLEPYISQYNTGGFFVNSNLRNMKSFHIQGDQLKDRVDIVDEIQEIIIGKPGGKPFRFVVTEKVSFHSYGKLYFRNELIDKSAYLLPDAMLILAWVKADNVELQKDLEPYISQYNGEGFFRSVVGRRDVKEFHIEEKQFVDNVNIVDELGEIKIGKLGIKFPLFIKTNEEFKKYQPYFIEKYNFKLNPFELPNDYEQNNIERSGGIYVYPYKNIFEPNKKEELTWSYGWTKPDLDEIKVNSPKPFVFEAYKYDKNDHSYEGQLYFMGKLLSDDAIYTYGIHNNKRVFYISFWIETLPYIELVDKLNPYSLSPYKPTKDQLKTYHDNYKHVIVIRDIDKVKLVNVPEPTNEIKIGKPRRFSPGEKVLNFKTPLIISSDPEKYYTEEYADPSYLVNNPKTGERFYINQDWIKKLPQDMDEIKVNKPSGELYPIVNVEGDIDYKNLVKNVKKFKRKIAAELKIEDTNLLNRLLTFYVNAFTEVEHQGDEELYLDMTVDEMIADIKGWYQGSQDDDWEPDPEYDVVTIEDIAEIKVNKPPGWKKFTLTKHNDYIGYETIAVTIKHPELKLWYFGYWEKIKDYIIWPYDDLDEEEGSKDQLINLLKKYNKPFTEIGGDDPYIKIPLSLIDVSQDVNEIKISTPGWKNFTLKKNRLLYDPMDEAEGYEITLKHPELRLHYFGHWNKNKNYVIWFLDDWDEKEGAKTGLINLLKKYNKPFTEVGGEDPYIKIPLSLIDMPQDVNEIKINKPGKAFTFVYKGPLHSGKEGEFYFGDTLLDKRSIYSQYNVATDAAKRRSISFGVDVEFYPQIKDQLRPYAEDAFTHDNEVILTMSDLSPVNLKGIDNVDEIKINFPGWKNFEAEIIDEDGEINILEIHHPEGKMHWFGHIAQGSDVINVEFGGDDPENEEYFAEQLTDILRKYNRPFERINLDDEMFWIKIPKSIVDIVDEVNEIKVSPPSTRFEFPLMINNQKDYDSYTKLLLQSGKYWFRNADGNLDDISSLVWPYVRPDNNPFPFCIKLNHYNPNVMHAVPGSACGIKEIKVKTPVNRIFTFVYNKSTNSSKKVGKFYFKDILLDDKAVFFPPVENGLRQNFIAFGVDVDLYPQIKDQLLPYVDKIGEKVDTFNHGNEVVLTISDLSLVHLKEINNIDEIKVKTPSNKPFKFIKDPTRPHSDWGAIYYDDILIDNNVFLVVYDPNNILGNMGVSIYKDDVLKYGFQQYVIEDSQADEIFGTPNGNMTIIKGKHINFDPQIDEIKVNPPMDSRRPHFDGKYVDLKSIELEDVFSSDYPDFADAYVSYATFEDGTELTSEQTDSIRKIWPDVFDQIIKDQGYYTYLGLDEIRVMRPGKVKAYTDGAYRKEVEVKPLKVIYKDDDTTLTWVEYPEGYLDIMIDSDGEKTVNHDVDQIEILDSYWFDNPVEYYINAAKKFNLKSNVELDEIIVKSPKNIIPLKFKKLITNYTGWNEGKEYSIDVEGFPEISATTYDDEPDAVYLYSKIGISDVKSLLDKLNIPYEELLKNVLVDRKYFSNYKVD